MICIVATLCARSDAVEEFRILAGGFVEASQVGDGNLAYDLYVARDDPASFVVFETRCSDIAIEAHDVLARFTTLVPRIVGPCAEPPSVVQYTEV